MQMHVAGTGKTRLLQEIVESCRHKNMLICAPTGLSANVLNERLPKGVHAATLQFAFGLMDGRFVSIR